MSFPALKVEMTRQNDVLLFRPIGWIAADGHALLEEKLHTAFAEGHRRIIVDLSAAHFVSSTGLGVFLYFKQILDDAGGRLVLAAPGGSVCKMLAAANLDKALTICASVAEACSKIRLKVSSRRGRAPTP
ncbi:MAG TPA: STAS domain-containing protein [Planctomycetota bacterium]|nr:STAS domain-containing protein [Planctomycetota bacterium]